MKTKILLASGVTLLLAALPLQADVREGLVSYWPLNTASGSFPMTTPDVVSGNDLTGPAMDSGSAIVSGKFGNAVTFDGASAYLLFTNATGADSGLPVARQGSWTYSLWVNGASGQPDQTTYFAEASGFNLNWRFGMEMESTAGQTEKTRYFIRDGNNSVKANYLGTTNTFDGTWHHVAYTYDVTTGRFLAYVDGQPNFTNTFTYTQGASSFNSVGIGALVRGATVNVFFAGAVDDVALWSRALSQAEIQNVYSNSIATPVPAFPPVVTVNPTSVTNLYEGDNVTLFSSASGTRPFYYQWLKDGTNYPGANANSLTLSSMTTNESGSYRLVITNATGSITSSVAQITVRAFAAPDLTNGVVAYWPLDSINGVKTPDFVSAYDMTVNNMSGANVVPGKWGNALSFTAANSQYARYIRNSGDALPAYLLTNFTVSVWVRGSPQPGSWFFAEASTLQNNAAFCIGPRANSGIVNTFVRTDGGSAVNDNRGSLTTDVWNDAWHNVVWVQRDVGGSPKASLYIDGALDPVNLTPAYGLTPNNTALASFARATPGQFFTGLIDEVVIWNRPLSSSEVALLQTSYLTNPPTRLTPLAINSFKSDLPAVATGDSTVLRWDLPANVNQVVIDPLGDVTAKTVSGVGSTNLTLTKTTTFVLTATRNSAALGLEVVKATNTIVAVDGVASNWSLLDNFDSYAPGLLSANGTWLDIGGSSVAVVTPTNCNRMAKTLLGSSGAYLKLNTLSVNSNQSATLFFRMIPQGNPASVLQHAVGITDASVQFYYQLAANVGTFVRPTVNDPSQNPGDWLLATRNIPYSPLTFATNVLATGAVYSVWIDVTNVFIGDRVFPDNYDLFSVYLQKEGDPSRTVVFENFISDRDLLLNDSLTGGFPTDNLSRIYLSGNSGADSALFDDFYLSKSGYNTNAPRAFGYAGPAPQLQIQWSGSQWQVLFEGKLQAAPAATGTYTNVPGATSPYAISTSQAQQFYRAVCE